MLTRLNAPGADDDAEHDADEELVEKGAAE
jgi:hypothetical protein